MCSGLICYYWLQSTYQDFLVRGPDLPVNTDLRIGAANPFSLRKTYLVLLRKSKVVQLQMLNYHLGQAKKIIKTSKINVTENFCHNFCYNRVQTRRIELLSMYINCQHLPRCTLHSVAFGWLFVKMCINKSEIKEIWL